MSDDKFYYVMGTQNRLGGRVANCTECGDAGFIAPSGEALLEGKIVVCVKCALSHMAEEEEVGIVHPPTPEQLKEVVDYFKRGREN